MRPSLDDVFQYLWMVFFGTMGRACATLLMTMLIAPIVFMVPAKICILVGVVGWMWMISDVIRNMNDPE